MAMISQKSVLMLCAGFLLISNALAVDSVQPDDAPLLTYGEHIIPIVAFEAYIDSAPPEGQYKLLKNPGRLRQVVTHLYLSRTLAAQALENNLLDSPLEQARFENLKNEHLSALQMRKLKADFAQMDDRDLEELAKEYYLAHPDEFQSPGTIHVSHILINKSREQGVGAYKYAAGIREKVLQGEDFAQLAQTLSDDPSAEDNLGDLGVQSVDNLIVEFVKGALTLSEPGEISELVRTEYGYHIIQFHAKTEPGLLPWDEVRGSLIKRSREKLVQQKTESYIESLKASKNYQINDAVLDKFVAEKLEQLQRSLGSLKNAEIQPTK